jgi:hypothetical protein
VDTRVAYWTEDAGGNLLLHNGSGQFLKSVPKAQASAYIAAYSSGNISATNVGATAGTGGSSSSGGGMTATQSSAAAHQQANLEEERRQFDLTQGERKARGDQSMQLDQAKQEWQKAIDARDFSAAERWRQVAADLDERKFKASISGPQDWVKYWRDSRGGGGQATQTSSVPAWAGSSGSAAASGAGVPSWATSTQTTGNVPAWALPVAPGGTSISQTDPRRGPVEGQFNAEVLSGPATATQGPTNEQLGAQDALIAGGRKPRFYSNGVAIF